MMYIVVFEADADTLWLPMMWDPDCDGAVAVMGPDDPVALFETRQAARTAIRISTRCAQLRLAQGLPANTDFVGPNLKFVRIVSCTYGPKRT